MTSMREKIGGVVLLGLMRRDSYDTIADAVLDALMVPTEGMLEYEIEPSDLHEKGDAELIWQAMITAAKEGK